MRWANKILATLLCTLPLLAQSPNKSDQEPSQELQRALEQMMLLLEKSSEVVKDLAKTEQKVVPEAKNSFWLYYKHIDNKAQVEKRNDLLLKAQIQYRLALAKDIPSSTILIVVHDGAVELYGKVHHKAIADKVIQTTLHTRGVKEVTSYLIIKELAKIAL